MNNTSESKYKKLTSKVDYKNPYMNVTKDLVLLPDGRKKYFYTLNRQGSFSIIIPLTKSGNTYLVGQYRYQASYYSWEFPMGFVVGKSPLQMAKTELKQETGIKAESWKEIGSFFVANGHSSQKAYIFVAQELKYGKPQPEKYEILELKKVNFSEIDKLIIRGKILDGCTISALHFYYKWKNYK